MKKLRKARNHHDHPEQLRRRERGRTNYKRSTSRNIIQPRPETTRQPHLYLTGPIQKRLRLRLSLIEEQRLSKILPKNHFQKENFTLSTREPSSMIASFGMQPKFSYTCGSYFFHIFFSTSILFF
jgi:hypothetical protein